MAQPQPYDRQYSFRQYQAQHPSDPLPGDQVDAEFDAVKATLDETDANLALIQRDDGQLANQIVGVEQLKPEILAGVSPVVPWSQNTEFLRNAMVFNGVVLYRCIATHVSGASFDASKFLQVADFSALTIPPGTVGTTQLADGGVTTAKIADGAVTVAKIGSLAANSLVGRAGSIGAAQNVTLDLDAFSFTGTVLGLSPGAIPTALGFTPLNPANHLNELTDKPGSLATLGGVATTRAIVAGTGLTGGGTLAADRTLAVAYGTIAGTAVQGNDARIVGALLAANELSEITALGSGAKATARGNIGLGWHVTTAKTGAAIGGGAVWAENHTIGSLPNVTSPIIKLTCLVGELNWVAGDVVYLQSGMGGSQNDGIIAAANSTQIKWAIGANGIRIIQGDGSSAAYITPAKWQLEVMLRYEN